MATLSCGERAGGRRRAMKAVVATGADRFEVSEVATPTPGRGQALLRVKSTTVCGTDQKILAGLFPGTKFPHIPGHEFAGEVVGVGDGVDEVQPGDRVGVEVHVGCGQCPRCLEGLYQLCLNYGRPDKGHAHIGFTVSGGLAEYAAVAVKALHKLPDRLSWDQGAFCDNIGVALYAIERGHLRAGESVVVIGAGAFGALAVQVARALGAARAVLLGTRTERMQRIAELADDVVVGSGQEAIERTRAALDGELADLVVEFAGSP